MNKEALTEREAAQFLGLAPRTLNNWRYHNLGPAFIRVGTRSIRYLLPDLEAYRQQQRTTTTEQK